MKKILYLALAIGALNILPMAGAEPTRDSTLEDLTFSEMLASVDPGKGAELIRMFQEKEARSKLGKFNPKNGTNLETCRSKEVLLLTIPADRLFAPNDVELKEGAGEYLAPVRRYLKTPDMYRVLLVMHTDNTGSDVYREELTTDRVEAVYEWFEQSGSPTEFLFSYAMADDMPLVPNTSMENRARNRRLEIYLMPGTLMVEQAKKGKIEY